MGLKKLGDSCTFVSIMSFTESSRRDRFVRRNQALRGLLGEGLGEKDSSEEFGYKERKALLVQCHFGHQISMVSRLPLAKLGVPVRSWSTIV
jgi:hypothetical protein